MIGHLTPCFSDPEWAHDQLQTLATSIMNDFNAAAAALKAAPTLHQSPVEFVIQLVEKSGIVTSFPGKLSSDKTAPALLTSADLLSSAQQINIAHISVVVGHHSTSLSTLPTPFSCDHDP